MRFGFHDRESIGSSRLRASLTVTGPNGGQVEVHVFSIARKPEDNAGPKLMRGEGDAAGEGKRKAGTATRAHECRREFPVAEKTRPVELLIDEPNPYGAGGCEPVIGSRP